MSTYWEVRSAIDWVVQSIVETITEIESVVIGPKEPPTHMPFCLIIPGTDNISPDSQSSDQHLIDTWVAVVLENEDVSAGVQSVIKLGGSVYDALVADHTWNGTVDEVYPRLFDPRFAERETYTRHWVLMQFTARYQVDRS